MGERLRYAQLTDPDQAAEPTPDSDPVGSRTDRRPPPDPDGLLYDPDLPTPTATAPDIGAQTPPDPALEAELAAMTHPTDPTDPTDPAEEHNR